MTKKDWASASDEEILEADLLIELNLSKLPEEEQVKVLGKMSEAVEQGAISRVLTTLNEEQRVKLKSALESNSPESLKALLEQEVPNFTELFQEELITYKRLMLTGIKPTEAPAS